MTEFDSERGYTFDHKLGERRELTDEERAKLADVRERTVRSSVQFVKDNEERFGRVIEGDTRSLGSSYITVAFDEEPDYVNFIKYVYGQFRGRGLEFTNVPVVLSTRVQGWLVRSSIIKFPLRPVSIGDFEKTAMATVSPHSFDPANLDSFHIPGFPLRD